MTYLCTQIYLISIEDRDEPGFTTQRCNFFLYTCHFPSRIFTFHRQHSQYIGSRSGNPAACFQLLFVGLMSICFRTDTQPIPHSTPCRKAFENVYGRGHCLKLTECHYIIKRQPARQNIVEKCKKNGDSGPRVRVVFERSGYKKKGQWVTDLMERKTRLELATPTLARSCSTN